IHLVEFIDLECLPCLESLSAWIPFPEDLRGRVRVTLLQFPLSEKCNSGIRGVTHPYACELSERALGGSPLGKELLLRRVRFPLEPPERVLKKFSAKTPSGSRGTTPLAEHVALGQKLKIHSTPAIWVNGKPMVPFGTPQNAVSFIRYLLAKDF